MRFSERSRLGLRAEAGDLELPVAARLATFRRRNARVSAGDLQLVAGDEVSAYLFEGVALAVIQEVDGLDLGRRPGGSRQWSRRRTLQQIRPLVAAQYPGFLLDDFEVVERGVSGRVGELRLHGRSEDGEKQVVDVEGLAIRWLLDVPDLLFTHSRLQGGAGWLFKGRGWGHGVGLCQIGAYGMAVRGHRYRTILEHYYSGARLIRVESKPERASSY